MLSSMRLLFALALVALPLHTATAGTILDPAVITFDSEFAPTAEELEGGAQVPASDEVSGAAVGFLGSLSGDPNDVEVWQLGDAAFLYNDSNEPMVQSDLGNSLAKISSWTASLKRDPFVTNNITVTNTSSFTQIFIASVVLPIPAYNYNEVINSSVSISATDSNGDGNLNVDSEGGVDFYRGRVNSTTLLPLDPAGLPLTIPASCGFPGCSASTSDGTASLFVTPGVANDLEIILRFQLSPGDTVGVTSRFEIIPEPTTALLVGLGLAGIAGVGRRRS